MRRLSRFLIMFILCVLALSPRVFAQTTATQVSTRAVVSSNGQASVTVTAIVNLDNPASGLTFPLPATA